MSQRDLAQLRVEIDRVDQALLGLLTERARLALEVGDVKKADNDAPVYRPEREAAVIAALKEQNSGPLPGRAVETIWREIMSACRGLERRLRVAYLGPEGTYSEQALRQQFGSEVDAVACVSIDEVFSMTESGAIDFGVVPVENSTEGSVTRTQDLFLSSSLSVVAEVTVRIRHVLMSKAGDLTAIRRVCAHPQGLAQCTEWLNRHLPSAERVPVSSNAEGARMAGADPQIAAIAGESALTRYDLRPVAVGIQDDPLNRTRFLVVGRQETRPSGDDKTSLILSVPNKAGAVHALIEPLARHQVSMTRFESRPARLTGWAYNFYIDVSGHRLDPKVALALEELQSRSSFFKCLGSYPADTNAN